MTRDRQGSCASATGRWIWNSGLARRPGFRTFDLASRPGDLRWARGRVPTPPGPVTPAWRAEQETTRGGGRIPAGTTARFTPPPGYRLAASANGSRTRRLSPGKHVLACRKTGFTDGHQQKETTA